MVRTFAIVILVGAAAGAAWTILPVTHAQAVSGQLSIKADRELSLLDEPVSLMITGSAAQPIPDAQITLVVAGPALPSQVGQADAALPQVGSISPQLTASGSGAVAGQSPGGEATAAGATGIGAGQWTATAFIPPEMLSQPGAYLLTVNITSGGTTEASGTLWVGKVARRSQPLDIAFVLPVALGVHQDANGSFFDEALEEAARPPSENVQGLQGLFQVPGRVPGWQLTLAVEPVLVAQLADMANGYARVDASGARQQIATGDEAAKNAAQTLAILREAAGMKSVEMAAGPYSGPAMGALAAEGWRDGLDQLQLGKEELQQMLGLPSPLVGAYAPGLDFTTASLAYYGQASVDHVVVDDRLAANLAEALPDGAVAARARDSENDRVTLMFADSRLSSLMGPPWDTGVFFAGLAAELASGPRDALVIAPGVDYVVPPSAYLEAIGTTLTHLDWVNTQTLSDLLRAHAPSSRPVLFNRDYGNAIGYVENSMLDSVRQAHAAVADLAAASDSTQAPLQKARLLLYTAESRWWWSSQSSPRVASIGLAYADQARSIARAELGKVHFTGAGPTTFWGGRGVIKLVAENGAGYPLKIDLALSPAGLVPAGENSRQVELQPGRNDISISVVKTSGAHSLDVRMVAGTSTLDEWRQSLSFITIGTIIPWAIGAVVVIGGVVFLALRRRAGRRRRPRSARYRGRHDRRTGASRA